MSGVDDITPLVLSTLSALTPLTPYLLFGLTVLLVTNYLFQPFSKTNPNLRGPPSKSFLLGASHQIRFSPGPELVYGEWVKTYGSVYRVPTMLGTHIVAVCDPKAAARIFAKDTFIYVKTPGLRAVIEKLVGRGVLWAEGESHRRQRKTLNPAFGPGAIRDMTGIFYDSAYRLKAAWEKILESQTDATAAEIEMHGWMTKLSLDSIGRAAFGHDFRSLEGQQSEVEEALSVFNTSTPSKLGLIAYVGSIFVPFLGRLPTRRNRLFENLSRATRDILRGILKEKQIEGHEAEKRGKSVVELLIDEEVKESTDSSLAADRKEEVIAQMKGILIAGSDPPGLVTTWALIELARNPQIQNRLREEITQSNLAGKELTYDQLRTSFPFLDAVLSEVLRLHTSVGETPRRAAEDDILHLKEPILDASGQLTDTIFIPKGTNVTVPNHYLNISEEMWGVDALVFNPDRWMNPSADSLLETVGADSGEKKSQTRPRIWSFGDGPRVCVGKAFALTQMKIVLSVLIRDFTFELPRGRDTPIDVHFSLVPRPKVEGLDGANFPFLVRRVR